MCVSVNVVFLFLFVLLACLFANRWSFLFWQLITKTAQIAFEHATRKNQKPSSS